MKCVSLVWCISMTLGCSFITSVLIIQQQRFNSIKIGVRGWGKLLKNSRIMLERGVQMDFTLKDILKAFNNFKNKLQLVIVLLLIRNSYARWSMNSLKLCGIFQFQFHFIFIKAYIFVQEKAWILFFFENIIIPFKIKKIEKPHLVLFLDLWF